MEYKHMQEVVDKHCKDMEGNPYSFTIDVNTFSKNGSGVKYWIPLGNAPITETWNGRSENQVFSLEQGCQIRKAFDKLRDTIASEEQKRVILSTQDPSVEQDKESTDLGKEADDLITKGLCVLFGLALFGATIWSLL